MQNSFDLEPTDLGNRLPSRMQRSLALIALAVCIAAYIVAVAASQSTTGESAGTIAVYGAGLAISQLLIALSLLGQLQMRRCPALAMLAAGFLLSALGACAYTILFPGLTAFPFVTDSRTGDWIYLCWHLALPLSVLAYACARQRPGRSRLAVLLPASAVSIATTLLPGSAAWIPAFAMVEQSGELFHHAHQCVLALSLLSCVALLCASRLTVLDWWLAVAATTWVLDLALSASFTTQAFDLGFYVGRMFALIGSLCLLGVLAAENIRLTGHLRAAFAEMVESRAREKSSALVAAVLQQLPQGVFVFDPTARRVIVNQRGAKMVVDGGGDPPGDGAPLDCPAVIAFLNDKATRATAGETFAGELIERTVAGHHRVYAVGGAPVHGDDGAVAATVIVVDDVTARAEADQALRRALDQTRALLENTPLAAAEWGPDQIVRMWSRRAEQVFGWRAEEVVGRPIGAIGVIHPDDAGKVFGQLQELLRGRDYVCLENRNLTRDGRVLDCEWHNSVLRNERGEIETVFSLALDITERERAMTALRDADQRKDVFIATLAHELRNPLAPIANAASLLTSGQVAAERTAWMAAMISRQCARMARLLEDLLDVSRISRGQVELRREPTDLVALAHEAVQISMPLIEGGRHHLALSMPDAPLWVDADPVRLAQVMSNLLNNAAKYTRPGGRIEVRLVAEDGCARFDVADDGIGIEAEMLDHVFDAFVQVGSARYLAQGGLGIGLSLSRGLVELHGGRLSAASAGHERGSTFTMCLPLTTAPDRTSGAPAGQEAPAPLDVGILIADDNVDAAESLAMLLRARGARVEVAFDGEQALRLFRARPADIVILDLGMPRIDGMEAARQLARAEPRPYLVALTGRGRQEDCAETLRAGFDRHLTKPADPQQLAELLRQVAQRGSAPATGTAQSAGTLGVRGAATPG